MHVCLCVYTTVLMNVTEMYLSKAKPSTMTGYATSVSRTDRYS